MALAMRCRACWSIWLFRVGETFRVAIRSNVCCQIELAWRNSLRVAWARNVVQDPVADSSIAGGKTKGDNSWSTFAQTLLASAWASMTPKKPSWTVARSEQLRAIRSRAASSIARFWSRKCSGGQASGDVAHRSCKRSLLVAHRWTARLSACWQGTTDRGKPPQNANGNRPP